MVLMTYDLYLEDNLKLMKNLIDEGKANTVDLIYIDPPFNSNRDYKDKEGTVQFTDIWWNVDMTEEVDELKGLLPQLEEIIKVVSPDITYYNYLVAMGIRLYYMRRLLKDTGSIYYHCDPTASHYIKIVMDYVFGIKNFRNEIVWWYDKFSNRANYFLKNHDNLFLYSKSDNYKFNKLEKEDYVMKDSALAILKQGYHILNNHKKLLVYDAEKAKDKIKECENKNFKISYQNGKVKYESDVFEIDAIPAQSTERLGYPTQKPEALLERIIKASSNEGDLVMDFYNGGGTTGAVCKKLNRNYLGCDINYRAIQITQERLEKLGCVLKKDLVIYGIPNEQTQ